MQSFKTVAQILFLKNFHKDGVASVTKLSKKVFSEPTYYTILIYRIYRAELVYDTSLPCVINIIGTYTAE